MNRTVRDIMTSNVITVTADMLVTDVMRLFLRWHISGVPVVDESGDLIGIVTEHDIINFALSGDAPRTGVVEVMTSPVETCDPDTLLAEVVNDFASRGIRRVPVVQERKVVGMISRRDIIREMDRVYGSMMSKRDTETEG